MKPISIQLYTLREMAKQNFIAVLEKVAEIGFAGVEPAGLFGHTPQEVRHIVEDLGMTVSSNHQPWPNRENLAEVAEVAAGLGTTMVICGFGPDNFKTLDDIKATAETANFIVERLTASGLSVAVHNHWWEFEILDGRLKYDIFMEMCPGLLCELDLYWASNFGANDVAKIVDRYRQRTPLLHVKDGTFDREKPQVPVGQGRMDVAADLHAADDNVLKWLIVELDTCDRDMVDGVAESYRYLTGQGLAKGRE
jgi:sugar phosphate isomerase/epimerase